MSSPLCAPGWGIGSRVARHRATRGDSCIHSSWGAVESRIQDVLWCRRRIRDFPRGAACFHHLARRLPSLAPFCGKLQQLPYLGWLELPHRQQAGEVGSNRRKSNVVFERCGSKGCLLGRPFLIFARDRYPTSAGCIPLKANHLFEQHLLSPTASNSPTAVCSGWKSFVAEAARIDNGIELDQIRAKKPGLEPRENPCWRPCS